MNAAAIVVAGGAGTRFGRRDGKQTAIAGGRPLVAWSVSACAGASDVSLVVVVAPADRLAEFLAIAESASRDVKVIAAPSGETRQDSVWSGLSLVGSEFDAVIVHDGARPIATAALVEDALTRLDASDSPEGVVVAHPSVDTVKTVESGVVVATPDRAKLWAVQTPQVFRRDAIVAAYRRASDEGFVGTDDSSLVERAGGRVVVAEGPRDNIKVTCPEDLLIADAVLFARMEDR